MTCIGTRALALLLMMFKSTLQIVPGTPRLHRIQIRRSLSLQHTITNTIANLCEKHLTVQRTIVSHGALGLLVIPLKRDTECHYDTESLVHLVSNHTASFSCAA